MKQIFLSVLLLSALNIFSQQSVVDDGKGETTILMPSSSISLNTSDPKLTVSYYYGSPSLSASFNDARTKINRPISKNDSIFLVNRKGKNFILGGAVSGKNSDGISALFQNGNFTPGGEFSALFGWKFILTRKYKKSFDQFLNNKDSIFVINKKINELIPSLRQDASIIRIFTEDTSSTEYKFLKGQSVNIPYLNKLLKSLNDGSEIPNKEELLIDAFNKISSLPNAQTLSCYPAIQDAISDLRKLVYLDSHRNQFSIDTILKDTTNDIIDQYLKHSLVIYGSGKYSIKGFTLYKSSNTISQKFSDTTVGTGYLKFNANYIVRSRKTGSFNVDYHILGFNFGYNWKDNYDYLKSQSIQTEQILYKDSLNSGKVTKTKDVKSGNYYYYQTANMDLDYLFIKSLDQVSILVNPYIRSTFAMSARDSVSKILTDINGAYRFRKGSLLFGTGFYLASPKNVFIGGLYFEYSAIPLQRPQVDAMGNDHLSTSDRFKKNVNFGLVFKVNLIKMRYDQLFANY